jgi:hypothetical protein
MTKPIRTLNDVTKGEIVGIPNSGASWIVLEVLETKVRLQCIRSNSIMHLHKSTVIK